jgi:hypothetical protein
VAEIDYKKLYEQTNDELVKVNTAYARLVIKNRDMLIKYDDLKRRVQAFCEDLKAF